jgi:hypothetical protein
MYAYTYIHTYIHTYVSFMHVSDFVYVDRLCINYSCSIIFSCFTHFYLCMYVLARDWQPRVVHDGRQGAGGVCKEHVQEVCQRFGVCIYVCMYVCMYVLARICFCE